MKKTLTRIAILIATLFSASFSHGSNLTFEYGGYNDPSGSNNPIGGAGWYDFPHEGDFTSNNHYFWHTLTMELTLLDVESGDSFDRSNFGSLSGAVSYSGSPSVWFNITNSTPVKDFSGSITSTGDVQFSSIWIEPFTVTNGGNYTFTNAMIDFAAPDIVLIQTHANAVFFDATGDGWTPVSSVPIPTAIALFGSALAGLGFMARRKVMA